MHAGTLTNCSIGITMIPAGRYLSYMQLVLVQGLFFCFLRKIGLWVQGTWFWQLAFILFNPNESVEKWEQDNPESIMAATLYFSVHLLTAFIGMLMWLFDYPQYLDSSIVLLNCFLNPYSERGLLCADGLHAYSWLIVNFVSDVKLYEYLYPAQL